jgi:hypothetical protein
VFVEIPVAAARRQVGYRMKDLLHTRFHVIAGI